MKDDGAIETRTSRIWLGDDQIMRVRVAKGAEQKLEDAVENIFAMAELSSGKRLPAIIDISESKSIARDARNYYASEKAVEVELALALVIGSPLSRLMGNFFLGLNKPPYPTRLFTSEQEAIAWLKGFQNERTGE